MTVSDINGKKAVTNYKTLKVYNIKDIPKISLIECQLETGRTHQIRVHLKYKDIIMVNIVEKNKKNITPKNIDLDIVYEDNSVLVINKPKGMIVHPGAGNFENTLVNALLFKYKNNLSDINGVLRPGIVHRIDKDTSGLLVIAKNNLAHANLGDQFTKHSIERKYLCLVWGVVRPLNGKICTLISRDKKNRQ